MARLWLRAKAKAKTYLCCEDYGLFCFFQGYGSRNGQALRIDRLEKVRESVCLYLAERAQRVKPLVH